MNTLIVTVGLPRSGKSTWARKQGFPVVEPDAIRQTLYGKMFWKPGESAVWTLARQMVCALFLAGHETVILDSTSIKREARDSWSKMDPPVGLEWEVKFASFPLPPKECKERVVPGVNHYLADVIDRMAEEFEPLGSGEDVIAHEVLWRYIPDTDSIKVVNK
ncbi:MAG: AAA family ATPase [Candidatus Thorarchaeota archaeon]|jgi:predicted kinase